jgi:hypothetical protein
MLDERKQKISTMALSLSLSLSLSQIFLILPQNPKKEKGKKRSKISKPTLKLEKNGTQNA